MAAKTWEADFRFPAIQASIRQLDDRLHLDPFETPRSFCLPVAEKPLVGWTPGWFFLIAIVLGFSLLLGALGLITIAEKNNGPASTLLTVLAVCAGFSGMAMFFLPLKCDRQIVRWLIGTRGREFVERAGTLPVMTAEVTNGDPSSMKISINGDDYGLIVADDANRRILIEGVGARYQIRSEDVERLVPFQFLNYLGVEVVYRVGTDAQLRLAVARTSLLLELTRQAPVLFFLRGLIANKLFNRFSQALGSGQRTDVVLG